jgi:NAD(P)-dependent dehydrogenase (short-subunit alcohol dehydrogenase family)
MSRIFITGSSDGLGQLAARELIAQGHRVVLHARNDIRASKAIKAVPGAETIVTGDLSNIDETKELATKANELGNFDAIIHNAGVYTASSTELFNVNTLAPYILTCLIYKPKRLIYLSSDMHAGGHAKLEYFKSDIDRITYSDTKLHVLMLCKAVARHWPDVYSNAVNPGWVPTKMGGRGAPDDLKKGYETQVWLAVSEDNKAKVSGKYFFHKREREYNREADDARLQDRFSKLCQELTGCLFPTGSNIRT